MERRYDWIVTMLSAASSASPAAVQRGPVGEIALLAPHRAEPVVLVLRDERLPASGLSAFDGLPGGRLRCGHQPFCPFSALVALTFGVFTVLSFFGRVCDLKPLGSVYWPGDRAMVTDAAVRVATWQ